jgi:[acyl-carrier-protein] S-malonyltransferase
MLQGVKDVIAVQDMGKKASEILGYDLLEMCLKGPESSLEQTRYCQPAMFLGGLAAVEKLKLDKPDTFQRLQACAGLSLGEYTALCVAGVFDFETGLSFVKRRGEILQEISELAPQGVVSVAGLDQVTLSKLCDEAKSSPEDVCGIANILFPKGFSCAGHKHCVEKLADLAEKTPGCLQVKLLKQSAGFHTSLMAPAREKLDSAFQELLPKMAPPRCDVYMNATGKKISSATPPSEIIKLMKEQLVSPVQWEPSVREMIKDGITEFYECGPMKQLKAMMKRIDTTSFGMCTTVDV